MESSNSFYLIETAALTKWLERPPREREVVGSIPAIDRPMPIKLVVVVFPIGVQDYGNSTSTSPPLSGL